MGQQDRKGSTPPNGDQKLEQGNSEALKPAETEQPKPERMEDVQAEFQAAVRAKEKDLQRSSSLDERVAIMEGLMRRDLQPSEVVKLAKRIRIMIHKSDRKDAVNPVPLSVNGYTITVVRGEVVEIPEHFLEVLENAVETHYSFMQDKQDPSILLKEERDAPSYPYSVNPRSPAKQQTRH